MLNRMTALMKWTMTAAFLISFSPAGIAEAHWWKHYSNSDTHKGVTVEARAVQKHNGVTFLELSTAGFDNGQIGPGTFQYVYVVAVSKKGKHHRTWQLFKPNTPGYAKIKLKGLLPGEEIIAYAYVDKVKKKQDILAHLKVEVQQLPDLGVSDLTVSSGAAPGIPTLISANITDHNNTLDSNFTCKLMVNGTKVDRATNISLPAGGSTQCMFVYTFAAEGQYQVEVRVVNVNPGEFARANNTQTVSVSVESAEIIPSHDNVLWSVSGVEDRSSFESIVRIYNGDENPANLIEETTYSNTYHRQNIRGSVTIAGAIDLLDPEFSATASHGGTVDFNLDGSQLQPITTNANGSKCRVSSNIAEGSYILMCNHASYSAAQPYPYGKVELIHVKGRQITFSEVVCHDLGICGSYAGSHVDETVYGQGTTFPPAMSEVTVSMNFNANGVLGNVTKTTSLNFTHSQDQPYECDYNEPNSCSSYTYTEGSGTWSGSSFGGQLLFQQ